MVEPLKYLLDTYGYDYKSISEIIFGAKNCAVKLKNGNIGVCATLRIVLKLSQSEIEKPDFNNIKHRIFLTAYFNAMLNYKLKDTEDRSQQIEAKSQKLDFIKDIDILDFINISSYKKMVMIGNFRPIVKKLGSKASKIAIFDYLSDFPNIIPQEQQKEYLQKSDAVILTATSIFNNTFLSITESSPKNCDIFVLGPSALVNNELFRYKNIKAIFGTLFPNKQSEVLEVIKNGGGTRDYNTLSVKVALIKN